MYSFDLTVRGAYAAVVSALPLLTLSFLQLRMATGKLLVICFLFHVSCMCSETSKSMLSGLIFLFVTNTNVLYTLYLLIPVVHKNALGN